MVKFPFQQDDSEAEPPQRAQWGSKNEFLMSCVATSVGLGNVWRFAFVAYANGGGAFLVPYLFVMIFMGKPMYYLEGLLGQFTSRNSIDVWAMSPGMRGTGWTQVLGCSCILSYYVPVVALCLYYLALSFQAQLPWAECEPEWKDCVPSGGTDTVKRTPNSRSSAELFFVKKVLQQKDGIEDGIGYPVWYLTVCLFVAWLMVFVIVARGIKSSGKAAYFLAIFPYTVMSALFVTTVLLPGASTGMKFFLIPEWKSLIQLDVWYAAMTQAFFSLSVCTGAIIMFSSYNKFGLNVYLDTTIVTALDAIYSLLAGFTIFGILGNLAHVLGQPVGEVVGSGGTGLAFISYPDAICKTFQLQLFSVLFFVMMTVLGVGSAVSLLSTVNTLLLDAFPRVRTDVMSAISCTMGFIAGLVYVTPGGQYILQLVDYYGATFLILFSAICEVCGVFWIYGLENFCLDIKFMLGRQTSVFWRFCWAIVTPSIMIVVFSYALFSSERLLFDGHYVYPELAYTCGYILLFSGIMLVPIIMCTTIYKNRTGNCKESVQKSFVPSSAWGPRVQSVHDEWLLFKDEAKGERQSLNKSKLGHIWFSLTNRYTN